MHKYQRAMELKESVFGGDSFYKAYSVRLPLELSAQIEAIAEVSGKSRNTLLTDFFALGLQCFNDHLDSNELSEIFESYDRIHREMLIDLMEK